MERLVKGLLDVALDAASSILHDNIDPPPPHHHPPSSSPPAAAATSELDRNTWAEVAAGNHGHEQQSWEKAQGSFDSQTHHEREEEQRWNSQENLSWSAKPQYSQDGSDQKWNYEGERRRPARDHFQVSQEQKNHFRASLHEQHFSPTVSSSVNANPTQLELQDLSEACNRLWELDLNRLVPGQDYGIDCGEGKKSYEKEDAAVKSLFDFVDQSVFRKPTYARFYALLDNYQANEGSSEIVTAEEQQEQCAFIEEISRTAPVQYLHKYLAAKGVVSDSYKEFIGYLTSIWFALYGRGGTRNSSSAFEHVFVGEIKHNLQEEVSGFHNWIQFYVEEANGRVDYQGYIFPRRRGNVPDSDTQLLTIQFKWKNVLKGVSSSFIGVSPEFELALYTLCFFVGEEDNHVKIGPYHVNIKCYRLGNNKIGSIFPVAED